MKILRRLAVAGAAAGVAWTAVAAVITWTALPTLRTDFYSSVARERVRAFQQAVGVRASAGGDWVHAGWIADPERETYRVYVRKGQGPWRPAATARYGSAVVRGLEARTEYGLKVETGDGQREIGTAVARTTAAAGPLERPVIGGPWKKLFRPSKAGDYVNDHAVFRDRSGRWRVLGITGPGRGDYRAELRLAQGRAPDRAGTAARTGGAGGDQLGFGEVLAAGGMIEDEPVADYRQPAWAPDVVRDDAGLFHLFWSPHRLAHAVSVDGVHWYRRPDAIPKPDGWFFRDTMILEVAPGQWLLYATARGWWYSAVDLYQSFDLDHWQKIGRAWEADWGSERNALVSSAESPFVVARGGRYYLSLTYNNETGIIAPIALALGYWAGGAGAYDDTRVFASTDPYDFGRWRGHGRQSKLVASLEAHAPEYVRDDREDRWYVTTCGWPLAATLTGGEVAAAPLLWELAGH